jgi:hypothetical protein
MTRDPRAKATPAAKLLERGVQRLRPNLHERAMDLLELTLLARADLLQHRLLISCGDLRLESDQQLSRYSR